MADGNSNIEKVEEPGSMGCYRAEFLPPRISKRRNSAELPPKMSESPTELRIVLLGKSVPWKNTAANLILNTNAFQRTFVLDKCESTRVTVEERHITVINTPDLMDPQMSHDKLSEQLRLIVTLSDPGPHVILLVLQPEHFTEEEGARIRNILDQLSDQSFNYSVVVLTTHKDRKGHLFEKKLINQMITECRGRRCFMNLSDRNELIAEVDNILEENKGGYLTFKLAADSSHKIQGKREVYSSTTEASLQSSSGVKTLKQSSLAHFDRTKSTSRTESIRIVLLGKSDVKKKTIGNMILQKESFTVRGLTVGSLSSYHQTCDSASGKMNGQSVTVIKTPDVFSMTAVSLMQMVEKCKSLSAPGPHVFLLVLKPEEFTEENRNALKWILSLFHKEAFQHSMVVITHKLEDNPHRYQIIKEWGGGHHKLSTPRSDDKGLTEKIQKMVRDNEWRYLIYNEEMTHSSMTPKSQRLNLVLCGRRGAGKTSVANAILGQRESRSSSVCVKREGVVCGRLVTIVEMPALHGTRLTQEDVMQETFSCVSLCDPGVHAFLLVVPVGPLTDEDKAEMETFQNILGPLVNDFSMVLFRQDYISIDKTAVDFVRINADTKQLIQKCRGNFRIFDASKIENVIQATDLVADIVKMVGHNQTCYTPCMYVKAQDLRASKKIEAQDRKIKDLEEKISNLSQGGEPEVSITECVRVVLIGKTGNGKSASANTILGREAFESESSTDSVTTFCQKGIGKVDGRTVAVVDTPGLFDTSLSNKDVQQEIVKCVTLSAPGPHVFIIVLSIGRITQEELDTLKLIKQTFGPQAGKFSMVLFTRGDDLRNKSIQDYIEKSKNAKLKKLITDCGERYHAFNNKDNHNRTQVTELFKKINKMVSLNKGSFYTNEMFQEAEVTIKQRQEEILKEKEMEIKADVEKLKDQHEKEMEKMKSKLEEERLKVNEERKLREKLLREREEAIRKEHEEKEEAEREKRRLEDEKRRSKEHLQRKIWEREKEEMEREIKSKKELLEKKEIEKKKEFKIRLEEQRRQEIERQEWFEIQERQFADLKRKQKEEMERREKEEQERRKKEEEERQAWQRKIEEAKKGQTKMQEVMLRRKEEWEEQLKKERKRKQDEERQRREKDNETLVQREKEQRRLREEFERERERERIKNQELEEQRREMEQKERDRIKEEFEEKRRDLTNKMNMLQEQWERQRREEQDRRIQEALNRKTEEKQRLKELEEHFRQEREEENMRKVKEDKARRDEEEKKFKEMEAEYERKTKEMRLKYEEEARRHAEEVNNFRGKFEMNMKEKFKKEYDRLNKLYGNDKEKLTRKIKELEEMHNMDTDMVSVMINGIKATSKCVIM